MASIKKLRIGSTEYDLGGSTDINVTVQAVTNQTLTVDVIYPTGITAGSKVNVGTPTLKIALTEAPGYSTGSITVNGNDTGKTTYLVAAADGMIIGATDAALLDKKPLIFSMVDSYVQGASEETPSVSINSGVFSGELYCSHENDQTKSEKMEAGKNYDIVPPLYVWGGEQSIKTIQSTPNNSFFKFSTIGVKLSGNVSSLYNFSSNSYTNQLRIGGAFMNCHQIVDASELEFSDLSGVSGYYPFSYFFCNCVNLKSAPKTLPKSAGSEWYIYMFSGCSSLVTAPELPATTLENYCYSYMFSGCSSLVTPPELPATTLSSRGYCFMFKGCSSLKTAPELPAKKLGDFCYYGMFNECSSLVTAPELPATTLTECCYQSMFAGCASLVTPPDLPATTLKNSCYYGMFHGCTSLVTPPELPATTLGENCYSNMFYECTSLATTPPLPATTLTSNCYNSMFYNCKSLITAPDLPAETLLNSCYTYMFSGCNKLNRVKIMAKNNLTGNMTSWLRYVSSTGTFVKSAGVEFPSGSSGIPSGWTVEEV